MQDLPKNVLKAYFDPSVEQESPACDSYVREVSIDDKGVEHVKYVPFDSKKYQDSLGNIDLWSLEALLKAGIDPSFGIHTGTATRLESESQISSAIEKINSVVESESKSE